MTSRLSSRLGVVVASTVVAVGFGAGAASAEPVAAATPTVAAVSAAGAPAQAPPPRTCAQRNTDTMNYTVAGASAGAFWGPGGVLVGGAIGLASGLLGGCQG